MRICPTLASSWFCRASCKACRTDCSNASPFIYGGHKAHFITTLRPLRLPTLTPEESRRIELPGYEPAHGFKPCCQPFSGTFHYIMCASIGTKVGELNAATILAHLRSVQGLNLCRLSPVRFSKPLPYHSVNAPLAKVMVLLYSG